MRSRLRLVMLVSVMGCTTSSTSPLTTDPSTLVAVSSEPPGANCAYGGAAISTGVDSNDNGTLDPDEVTSTQYVCNGTTVVRCADGGTSHEGSVVIRDAADFAQLDGVSCINGDLIIAGVAGDLPVLADLDTVTGEIVIAGNPDVTSLDGLDAVRQVGQSYLVQGNDSLGDIAALAALEHVSGVFLIGNNNLLDLVGLSSSNTLKSQYVIQNNLRLASLHGLENVQTSGSLFLRSNPSLIDVTALANLRSVPLLEISGNAMLTTIDLPSLQKVDVRALINQNPVLTHLGMPLVSTMGDTFQANGNVQLATLSLPSLLTTGALDIENDSSLTTIDFPAFAFGTTDMILAGLPVLATTNFPNLAAVGGTLRVMNVGTMTGFTGFENLGSVGGLYVTGTSALVDFSGLSSLLTVAGDMTVFNNTHLTSFSGLDGKTTIGGNLTLSSNPALSQAVIDAFLLQVQVHGATTVN